MKIPFADPRRQFPSPLEAALAYSARGWAVFPVEPMSKRPLGRLAPHGFQDATTDAATIQRWWTEEPTANVGIATGAVSGFDVLDVDRAHGGFDSLRALEQQIGSVPYTLTAHSGGGGAHLYFAHPADTTIPSGRNRAGRGLDVKGNGGYIVAPPSGHGSGGSYMWATALDTPLAPWPAPLLAALRSGPNARRPGDGGHAGDGRRIPEGARNETLTRLAGGMRRQGAVEGTILAALQVQNATLCDPPLDDQELIKITHSVMRYQPAATWPVLDPAALHGLAGDFVRLVSPHTEADPVALLVQFLVEFGSVIGRHPYVEVEADHHYANLYTVLVGATSKGRKGTSEGQTRARFRAVDQGWAVERIQSGLSSGEGLIWAVRDAIIKNEPIKERGRTTGYQDVRVDAGVNDKRLLVVESEFASVLRVLQRDGNTLSAILRGAWDTGTLRVLTKNSPAVATNAHISMIAHTTQGELLRYLDRTELGNGFANRFLFVCVRRSRVLPEGGAIDRVDFRRFNMRLVTAIEFARRLDAAVPRDAEAREHWRAVYPVLSEGRMGLIGAITNRSEAQVTRLAMIYALLDGSNQVRRVHLNAALALWAYCDASAGWIFTQAVGDRMADDLHAELITRGAEGMTRTEIRDFFGRHQPAERIDQVLDLLRTNHLAREAPADPGQTGRPAERWVADSVASGACRPEPDGDRVATVASVAPNGGGTGGGGGSPAERERDQGGQSHPSQEECGQSDRSDQSHVVLLFPPNGTPPRRRRSA